MPGTRHRRRLGQRDLRRAPGRRAEAGLDAVDHRDVVPVPDQFIGDAEPDHAAARDDYAHPRSRPDEDMTANHRACGTVRVAS
jgi:hypothetical protein